MCVGWGCGGDGVEFGGGLLCCERGRLVYAPTKNRGGQSAAGKRNLLHTLARLDEKNKAGQKKEHLGRTSSMGKKIYLSICGSFPNWWNVIFPL